VQKKTNHSNQALIIVHLSSLDIYTSGIGQGAGRSMAKRLSAAARNHNGPIIVIDQLWELEGRASDPRVSVYEAIQNIPNEKLVLIRHDEDDSPTAWTDLFDELVPVLNELGVDSVKIAGFWYDPKRDTGCAWYVGQQLSDSFDVTYARTILGSYEDVWGPDDEDWDDAPWA